MRQRLVLVHGSVIGGARTWSAQRPLRERFELVVIERRGFPPRPPVERVDFAIDADLLAGELRVGDHLVGHSYGGVICLLAAASVSRRLGSMTVIEPPCTQVALDNPAVAAFRRKGEELWAHGPRDDPAAFLRSFLAAVGTGFELPSPLPADLEQGARILVTERAPWEAEIPLAELAEAAIPTLVVSGGHHPAFDAICAALAERLDAELRVLPGYGHAAQRHPDFNDLLADFVTRASR